MFQNFVAASLIYLLENLIFDVKMCSMVGTLSLKFLIGCRLKREFINLFNNVSQVLITLSIEVDLKSFLRLSDKFKFLAFKMMLSNCFRW